MDLPRDLDEKTFSFLGWHNLSYGKAHGVLDHFLLVVSEDAA